MAKDYGEYLKYEDILLKFHGEDTPIYVLL